MLQQGIKFQKEWLRVFFVCTVLAHLLKYTSTLRKCLKR